MSTSLFLTYQRIVRTSKEQVEEIWMSYGELLMDFLRVFPK